MSIEFYLAIWFLISVISFWISIILKFQAASVGYSYRGEMWWSKHVGSMNYTDINAPLPNNDTPYPVASITKLITVSTSYSIIRLVWYALQCLVISTIDFTNRSTILIQLFYYCLHTACSRKNRRVWRATMNQI